MAKAQFERHQRVWVDAVGAWSVVERIIPVWSKGFDEPIRILYDVGLGREFTAAELRAAAADETSARVGEHWRILRARNKWQSPADCAHHPHPGTFPIVVTDTADWGGWRTPGAEYDRGPERIERQARLIAAAPRMMAMIEEFVDLIDDARDEAPAEVQDAGLRAKQLLGELKERSGPAPVARAAPSDQLESSHLRHSA